jgi:hypothetical protein
MRNTEEPTRLLQQKETPGARYRSHVSAPMRDSPRWNLSQDWKEEGKEHQGWILVIEMEMHCRSLFG